MVGVGGGGGGGDGEEEVRETAMRDLRCLQAYDGDASSSPSYLAALALR